jgi:peptidoglycan/LPS O-acetylase OafA/YrhL
MSSTSFSERFSVVDGLRGLAALAVVIYHFHDAIIRSTPAWLPAWLESVARRGYLGVDVFFVISGFVIAFSVRNRDYTMGYLGRFALRRSIRLDPPYWITIALEVALIQVSLIVVPSLGTPIPALAQIGAHLLYVQDLAGQGNILPIFWTLCYEIQFYLFFVGTLVLWSGLRVRVAARLRTVAIPAFLGLLFLLSIASRFAPDFAEVQGLALDRWFQFFVGVLTYWTIAGRCSWWWLLSAWGVIAAVVAGPTASWEQMLPIAVSTLILGSAARGDASAFSGGRVLQYLGLRSYSLYLLHLPIGWRVISLAQLQLGDRIAPPVAWAIFGISLAGCIVAVEVMYRWVERPTIAWSKRLLNRPQLSGVLGPPEATPALAGQPTVVLQTPLR